MTSWRSAADQRFRAFFALPELRNMISVARYTFFLESECSGAAL